MGTKADIEQPEEGQVLSSIKKEEGYSVPVSYFDDLPSDIIDRIHKETHEEKRTFILKPVIAFATLLVLAGIATLFLLFNNENLPAETELSDLEIEHVLENPELYNISEEAVTEQYLSLNISDESIAEDLTLPEEEIRSYLEETPELTEIINEY